MRADQYVRNLGGMLGADDDGENGVDYPESLLRGIYSDVYGNSDIILGHFSRIFQLQHYAPLCHVQCSTSYPCLSGAGWCLESDVVTDSGLQGPPRDCAGRDARRVHQGAPAARLHSEARQVPAVQHGVRLTTSP